MKDNSVFNNLKLVPIDSVIMYEGNVKSHTTNQVRKVANSILNYGWDQPIIVDKNNVIIKGHCRMMAARHLGLTEIPVAVNYDLTEEEARASRIADNKVAESDWEKDLLWEELAEAKKEGVKHNSLGFDVKDMRKLFPETDYAWDILDIPPVESDTKKKDYEEQGGHDDPTLPQIEGFITPHKGKDAWLRKLSMVDYLNYHEFILVGISGGKDSLVALLWALENCERSKIIPYFSNLAWGVDWPHGIAFIQLIEKKYDCKVHICGPTDPAAPGRFEDLLLEYGYMRSHSCWYRNYIKVGNIKSFREQEKLLPIYGNKVVQILGVRWAESKSRLMTYPDRGYLRDDKLNYASPILQWTDADIIHYLSDRDIKLHTAYQHSNRMGCMACPSEDKKGCITIRKKFPLFFRQILEWHGKGNRKLGLNVPHICRLLSSIDDLSELKKEEFKGMYGDIALSNSEFEDYLEEQLNIKLPIRPYLTRLYDPNYHNFRNDLKPGSFQMPTNIKDMACDLVG